MWKFGVFNRITKPSLWEINNSRNHRILFFDCICSNVPTLHVYMENMLQNHSSKIKILLLNFLTDTITDKVTPIFHHCKNLRLFFFVGILQFFFRILCYKPIWSINYFWYCFSPVNSHKQCPHNILSRLYMRHINYKLVIDWFSISWFHSLTKIRLQHWFQNYNVTSIISK